MDQSSKPVPVPVAMVMHSREIFDGDIVIIERGFANEAEHDRHLREGARIQ